MCFDKDGKEDGMDAPGFASPIRAYKQNLCQMRKSNETAYSRRWGGKGWFS